MAFGIRKKQTQLERKRFNVILNAPFAFTLGEEFQTNRALLHELTERGCDIRLSLEGKIPQIDYFFDLPMRFRLPKDQATWEIKVDVERIFSSDEHERPVYGLVLKFRDLTKEQHIQLHQYIETRTSGTSPQ